MHIANLYKEQDILMFKECYALEKIHGTSSHLSFKKDKIEYFSGGTKYNEFIKVFNDEDLRKTYLTLGIDEFIVYGEAYGGKCQGMSKSYGDKLRFVAFDVKIGHSWLSVPQANEIVLKLGLDFVDYKRIPTTLEAIDVERDAISGQAVECGMGTGHKREGIVLRPLIEVIKNNGERIMAKHKREDFQETKSKREVTDPAKLEVLVKATEIAEEWVTPMRLQHVLDKIENLSINKMPDIIKAMIEDVKREGEKEILWSKAVNSAISKKTAQLVKQYFQNKLKENFEEQK